MTSSRPYLVRAMYQWIVDNGMTPHLLVNAEFNDCKVPNGHVNDGKIVLNIAPMAVQGLTLGDAEVSFSARFGGKSESILVPVPAILAVYARENGQGMMFSDDDKQDGSSGHGSDDGPDTDPDKPRPNLRVVK